MPMFPWRLAHAQFVVGDYSESIRCASRCLELRSEPEALRVMAASFKYLGEIERAERALKRMYKLHPNFLLRRCDRMSPRTRRPVPRRMASCRWVRVGECQNSAWTFE